MKLEKTIIPSSLGSLIRLERKRAGLTQAQLGDLIGLKAARVSKIERGNSLTPEVASFILGKLGSNLEIKLEIPQRDISNTSDYLMPIIHWYSRCHNITLGRAYDYLKTFKGVDFLMRYQDIEQSLPREEILEDLNRVCRNNGGCL